MARLSTHLVSENHRCFNFVQMLPVRIFRGMVLAWMDFYAAGGMSEEVVINDSHIEFSFHVSGHGRGVLSRGHRAYETVSVGPATSLITYNPNATCRLQTRKGDQFRALNIYMQPHLLEDLLQDDLAIMPNEIKRTVSGRSTSPFNFVDDLEPAMAMIVDQIINCSYKGAIKRMYLETKALELLTCRLARFKTDACLQAPSGRLNSTDTDRIHEARDRLLSKIDAPPSLAALARQVGMNTSKLARGFRTTFGTTAFDLLRRERVERARITLKAGKMNITETAYHFGYSDASHFIREFVKFYGTTPGAYLRTCR